MIGTWVGALHLGMSEGAREWPFHLPPPPDPVVPLPSPCYSSLEYIKAHMPGNMVRTQEEVVSAGLSKNWHSYSLFSVSESLDGNLPLLNPHVQYNFPLQHIWLLLPIDAF